MTQRTSHAVEVLAAVLLVAAGSTARAAGGTVAGKVDVTPAKYLAETVVYLKGVPGNPAPRTRDMDQRGMQFVPHLLVITAGDTVKFLNHDSVAHNVYSPDNEGYNLGSFKQGESRTYTFKSPGLYTQLCSIHPEMLGYIFVGDNPHAAAVDAKGRYELANVPPGTYRLAVWNSHLKAPPDKSVTVTDGKTIQENLTLKR